MKTKLTLSVNKRSVDRAKRVAKKRGKSLSQLVERYIDSLEKEPTVVDAMVGIIQLPKGVSAEDIILKEMKKKHLK